MPYIMDSVYGNGTPAVDAAVASVVAAYGHAAALLNQIKVHKFERTTEVDLTPLDQSLRQALNVIEGEWDDGVAKFGAAFEDGDEKTVTALQLVDMELRTKLVGSLRAAVEERTTTNIEVVLKAADRGRTKTQRILSDLYESLIHSPPPTRREPSFSNLSDRLRFLSISSSQQQSRDAFTSGPYPAPDPNMIDELEKYARQDSDADPTDRRRGRQSSLFERFARKRSSLPNMGLGTVDEASAEQEEGLIEEYEEDDDEEDTFSNRRHSLDSSRQSIAISPMQGPYKTSGRNFLSPHTRGMTRLWPASPDDGDDSGTFFEGTSASPAYRNSYGFPSPNTMSKYESSRPDSDTLKASYDFQSSTSSSRGKTSSNSQFAQAMDQSNFLHSPSEPPTAPQSAMASHFPDDGAVPGSPADFIKPDSLLLAIDLALTEPEDFAVFTEEELEEHSRVEQELEARLAGIDEKISGKNKQQEEPGTHGGRKYSNPEALSKLSSSPPPVEGDAPSPKSNTMSGKFPSIKDPSTPWRFSRLDARTHWWKQRSSHASRMYSTTMSTAISPTDERADPLVEPDMPSVPEDPSSPPPVPPKSPDRGTALNSNRVDAARMSTKYVPVPSANNDYLDFCYGAWRLQIGAKDAMKPSRSIGPIKDRSRALSCCNKRCRFEDQTDWTKVWELYGVRYRRAFLAKSHVEQKKSSPKPRYQCMFCAFQGYLSNIFAGADALIFHISNEHRGKALPKAILNRANCITEYRAGEDTQFDINLVPFGQECTPRMTSISIIPTNVSNATGYASSGSVSEDKFSDFVKEKIQEQSKHSYADQNVIHG